MGKIKHGLKFRKGNRVDRMFCSKFSDMKTRCKRDESYIGISVLRNSLSDFKNDMYESYIEHINKYGLRDTTIDRIDSTGDYCKDNCRWATFEEQFYNKTNTLSVVIDGTEYNSLEFAKKYGISTDLASSRISKYLKGERSLESICVYGKITANMRSKTLHTNPRKCYKHFIEFDGKIYNGWDMAEITGMTYTNSVRRIILYKKGYINIDELFSKNKKTCRPSVICEIGGVVYNKKTLSNIIGCNNVTARARIKKYNEGIINEEQLFQKTFSGKNTY